jgi:hypothetical protein
VLLGGCLQLGLGSDGHLGADGVFQAGMNNPAACGGPWSFYIF